MDASKRGAGVADAYGFQVRMDIPTAEAYYTQKLTALGYALDTRKESVARKDYLHLAFARDKAKYIVSLLSADNRNSRIALLIFRPEKQRPATSQAGAVEEPGGAAGK